MLAVAGQQQTTPMVLMVVILLFLPLHQQAVVAVVAHNLRQVQMAVQAVVAVKNHLREAQETRLALHHLKETMAVAQAVLTTT